MMMLFLRLGGPGGSAPPRLREPKAPGTPLSVSPGPGGGPAGVWGRGVLEGSGGWVLGSKPTSDAD